MTDKIVLALIGRGANDALRGLMMEYGDALKDAGQPVVYFVPADAELDYAVQQMGAGRVSFALTLQGVGHNLPVSVGSDGHLANGWEACGIPLISLHGDSPAYFPDRHRDIPSTAVHAYHATEFREFRRRWLTDAHTLAASVPPLPMRSIAKSAVDLAVRKRGKLVFLKNGNSPAGLTQMWREKLPSFVATLLESMAESITPKALKKGVLHIGDFVSDGLAGQGIEPASANDLLLFLSAQLDDYLRRVKSQMIAEAILDLPVIVQGNNWEHVDLNGRKAQLVEGQDFEATQRVFTEQLGIIDMAANVDTWPHDRVQRAAGAYALAITNRQGWVESDFAGFEEILFDFDPESIRSRVADAIAHPDRYLELAVAFGERFRERYPREQFARRVIDLAEVANLQYGRNKPAMQRYIAWSARG